MLHVRFSAGPSASAEAWVNGVHSPRVHVQPNMAGAKNYLKMGIYRDER